MLGGGAAVYNLDWSYTVGFEQGGKHDAQVMKTPSGPVYRHVMSVLANFMTALDLSTLHPRKDWIALQDGGSDARVFALAPLPSATLKSSAKFAAYIVAKAGASCIVKLSNATATTCSSAVLVFVDPQSGLEHSSHIIPNTAVWTDIKIPLDLTADGAALTVACK